MVIFYSLFVGLLLLVPLYGEIHHIKAQAAIGLQIKTCNTKVIELTNAHHKDEGMYRY